MKSNSSSIYRWVVDDVISKMKPEFIQEGVDESILDTLRQKWEAKLTQNGLIADENDQGTRATATGAPAQASNPQAGHTGVPGMLPLPPQLQQHLMLQQQQRQLQQQQLLTQQHQQMQRHGQQQPGHIRSQVPVQRQPHVPFMPGQVLPPSLGQPGMVQQHMVQGVLGKRKEPEDGLMQQPQQRVGQPMPPGAAGHIPQRDGPGDDEDDEDCKGDGAGGSGAGGAEEEPADDEILSDDSEIEEEEEEVKNFLCCQFEKVARTKNRWKITMREGVFHIDGKDYLFKKANGEWTF